jgi:hypothetical protein
MSDIGHMVAVRLKDTLTTKLQTEITPTDPDYADVVKYGKLQDNITKAVQVGVMTGNPDKPGTRSGIHRIDEWSDDMGLRLVDREIGGGQFWYLNGICQVQCHYTHSDGFTEEQASSYAHMVIGRAEKTISESVIWDLGPDEFGKAAKYTIVYGRSFDEIGGADYEWTWRGSVYWAAEIEVPFQ